MGTAPMRNDIEEPPDVLDADPEIAKDADWRESHRQVQFASIDYTLGEIADLARSGDLDLQPQYQRRLRWRSDRQSRLIESFLLNVPVPPVYLSEEQGSTFAVIDGKQRITAVAAFLSNELPLQGLSTLSYLNGQRFGDLPASDQRFLTKRIPIRAHIIVASSPPELKLEAFHRLNTGGVALNSQEVRNIAFSGPLNDLIMALSVDATFHGMLGIRDRNTSRLHQEMRDAELVLRFLAFRDSWQSFGGSVKRHMDEYMLSHRDAPAREIDYLGSEFVRVLRVVQAAFGDHAFRRYHPERGQWRSQVVAALFDAQMLGSASTTEKIVVERAPLIKARMQGLFEDEAFRQSTEAATNATTSLRYRVTSVQHLISDATTG